MDWTEVKINVPSAELDRAADIAQMVVPYGIYIEDYSDLENETWEIAHIDLIDEELLAKDRTRGIIHVYISPEESPDEALAFLKERYSSEKISFEINTASIRMEEWANNWKKYFKPLKTGKKLVICPTWETFDETTERKILRIDPGMAFGTGGHNTTRLCLETMEKYIDGSSDVLDIGCGSGILSIAALLLGAKRAVGVDIDALAVKTAEENGALNGFYMPEYSILQGNLTEKVQGVFSVVVANIVADVIIKFCEDVGAFMDENGVFITSGIIDTREDDVKQAFARFGFSIMERHEDGGWICFVCKRT